MNEYVVWSVYNGVLAFWNADTHAARKYITPVDST